MQCSRNEIAHEDGSSSGRNVGARKNGGMMMMSKVVVLVVIAVVYLMCLCCSVFASFSDVAAVDDDHASIVDARKAAQSEYEDAKVENLFDSEEEMVRIERYNPESMRNGRRPVSCLTLTRDDYDKLRQTGQPVPSEDGEQIEILGPNESVNNDEDDSDADSAVKIGLTLVMGAVFAGAYLRIRKME